MANVQQKFKVPVFNRSILVIVGGYGSGKSEVAVNLARMLAADRSLPVAIADLDIVNPYFRSREAARQLESLGVTSINPRGDNFHADLPIVLPDIKGAIQRHSGVVVLDVGGDDVGARILSSLADAFVPDTYELLLVLNANRPFTADVASTLALMEKIETSSKLTFTGIISNTHMMECTTAEEVLSGLDLARKVSSARGIPVVFVSAVEKIAEHIDPNLVPCPLLTLNRSLLKPWERPA